MTCWIADTGALARELSEQDDPDWRRWGRIAILASLAVVSPTAILFLVHFIKGCVQP